MPNSVYVYTCIDASKAQALEFNVSFCCGFRYIDAMQMVDKLPLTLKSRRRDRALSHVYCVIGIIYGRVYFNDLLSGMLVI